MPQPGTVYLISCQLTTSEVQTWGGASGSPTTYLSRTLYKIGLTRDLERRLWPMRRSSPLPIEVIWTIQVKHPFALENALHRLYAKHHDHGEWYWLTDKQVAWIQALDEETIERLIEAREKARQQERDAWEAAHPRSERS